MEITKIRKKLVEIIEDQLGMEGEITDNSSFANDLGADSLDEVELVMRIEEEFDIEIADNDAEKIKTVRDAIDLITEITFRNSHR